MKTLLPERLTRLGFLVRCVLVGLLSVPVRLHFQIVRENTWPLWDWLGIGLMIAFAAYSVIFISIPRGVDIGISRIFSGLLSLVPMVNVVFGLFLLFARTDALRRS
jgi:hypothetical protein